MSYTPGPWRVADDLPSIIEDSSHNPRTIDGLGRAVPHSENEANARLIAAAPDLLEAAKLQVLNFKRQNIPNSGHDLGDDDHEAWTALEKAIAKAEGRA